MANQDDYTRITLRIPKDLHARLTKAAEQSSKSMNAEIIARLELSALPAEDSHYLLPAKKARELSGSVRDMFPVMVRERALKAITEAVKAGQASAVANFEDLRLDDLPSAELEGVTEGITKELSAAGYRCDWDGGDSLVIWF